MANDKVLNIILSKIEELDSKVSSLDSKVNKMDSKIDRLDSRVDGLENNLSYFRNDFDNFSDETNDTLARIEHRSNATFEQTAMLSEFRTDTLEGIDELRDDIGYILYREAEKEK